MRVGASQPPSLDHRRTLPEVSERRACHVLGQPREVQRYTAPVRDNEAPLMDRIVDLASQPMQVSQVRLAVPSHTTSSRSSANDSSCWTVHVPLTTPYACSNASIVVSGIPPPPLHWQVSVEQVIAQGVSKLMGSRNNIGHVQPDDERSPGLLFDCHH